METLPVGPIESRCHLCGRRPQAVTVVEEPLLRHAGYGEARRVTADVCCGVSLRSVESLRPERRQLPVGDVA